MRKIAAFVTLKSVFTIIFALSVCVLNPVLVVAAGFTMPEEKTNRQKAHLDVSFTGSTSTQEKSSPCSATGLEPGEISKDFTLGTDPAERRVNLMKALMGQYGLTPEQAAGPIGNFMRESGGAHLPPNVNEGGHAGPPAYSGGYGWAQWTGGRQTAFINFAVSHGYMDRNDDPSTEVKENEANDAANFAYLVTELNGSSYQSTITELKKQTTPENAAVSFEATFERAGVPALEERKTGARQAFSEYVARNGNKSASTGGVCGSTSSANFGDIVFPLKGSKKVVLNPGMFHDGTADQGGHPYIAYDILARSGTEVVAFASGKVSYTSVDRCGGKFITIWNEQAKLGLTYMHLSEHIAGGTTVKAGDHVGTVGSAAAGCGVEHLHIDAATDKVRQACSREGCTIQDHFRDIGADLYKSYQLLPEN